MVSDLAGALRFRAPLELDDDEGLELDDALGVAGGLALGMATVLALLLILFAAGGPQSSKGAPLAAARRSAGIDERALAGVRILPTSEIRISVGTASWQTSPDPRIRIVKKTTRDNRVAASVTTVRERVQ